MNCLVNPTTQFNKVRKYLTPNEWHFWKHWIWTFSDLFAATISGECVVLVLLDLPAAFNNVDHEILMSCMEE